MNPMSQTEKVQEIHCEMGQLQPENELSGVGDKDGRRSSKFTRFLRENIFVFLTLMGIAIGFAIGLTLQHMKASSDVLLWIGVPGELFLRSLKATIVPIIVCMVITSTSSLDPTMNRRIAVVGVLSFFVTSVLAVITATVLFAMLKPSAHSISTSSREKFDNQLETQDIFLDLLRNIFPDNVVESSISQTVTEYTKEEPQTVNVSASNASDSATYKKSLVQSRGINILGLITVCAAIGAAANSSLPQDSAFLSFFRQGQTVVMKVMTWLTWTTPVGVASLIAKSIAGVSNLGVIFLSLSRLVLVVVLGLAFHQVVTLPVIFFILSRKNPFAFLARCGKAFFVSFAATATSVALPHMLEASRQNGVSGKVSRFVVPMSVTLHADASALYIASATLFVAHTTGEESLSVADYFIVGLLSSIFSMTIPAVPSASIVTVAVILTSINQPLQGIALLFTVEWILDRLRSGVNATSHVICAAYTDVICNGRNRVAQHSEDDADEPRHDVTMYSWDTPAVAIENRVTPELKTNVVEGLELKFLRDENNADPVLNNREPVVST